MREVERIKNIIKNEERWEKIRKDKKKAKKYRRLYSINIKIYCEKIVKKDKEE